jgi:hypothetical protein
MSNTPLAGILNEADRVRKDLIRKIQQATKTKVISYISNPNASPNFIDHNDPTFLNDILESVGETEKLDLIIESPGGELNATEKMVAMCRSFCKHFRVIVINRAKSAATMLALSSDEILMGYLSELGPIDPQIQVVAPGGRSITFIPAQSIIDSLSLLNNSLQQGFDQRAVIALIQKIDTPLIDVAHKSLLHSKAMAEEWLLKYMLKDDVEKAKKIAQSISDNNQWLSHGRRIDYNKAKDLGLNVTLIDRNDILWKNLWEYYSRAFTFLNNTSNIKLLESESAGLNLGGPRIPQQQ